MVENRKQKEKKKGLRQDTAPKDMPPVTYFLWLGPILTVSRTSKRALQVHDQAFKMRLFYMYILL
jgi:hypothetical protein